MNLKFYTLEESQVSMVQKLFARQRDNEYYVLNRYRELSDIIQYSCKYQNIHICTVPTEKLEPTLELKY